MKEKQNDINLNKKNNKLAVIGFITGIIAVFIGFGIIPIIGLLVSIIALIKFNLEKEKNKWVAIAGLILNFIYFVVYLYNSGYF